MHQFPAVPLVHPNSPSNVALHVGTATKLVERDVSRVADTLGVSAIIVQDLKQRRLTNYKFDWAKMLQFSGDTGVFLQYTHARLCRSDID